MMPRLPMLREQDEDDRVRSVFALLEGDGRRPSPLYRTLAHAPKTLAAWAAMARPLRSDTSLAPHLREVAILRVAQVTGAPYVWAYHRQAAAAAGVTKEQVDALEVWRSSEAFDDRERAVLTYIEAFLDLRVDDAAFDALTPLFTAQEIVELTVITGFYAGAARVVQALRIEVDPEHACFLP